VVTYGQEWDESGREPLTDDPVRNLNENSKNIIIVIITKSYNKFLFFSYYTLFFILLLLYPMLDNLTKINFGKGYPNFYMLVSPVAWQSKL
jgi:hypothetical protein